MQRVPLDFLAGSDMVVRHASSRRQAGQLPLGTRHRLRAAGRLSPLRGLPNLESLGSSVVGGLLAVHGLANLTLTLAIRDSIFCSNSRQLSACISPAQPWYNCHAG